MEVYEGGCELKLLQTLEGHTDRVWSLSWNPATGSTGTPLVFASCSGDKTVRIWEQTPSPSSSYSSWHCKVSFTLISVTKQTNKQTFLSDVLEFHQAVLEDTHTRTVRSCAWSPSGKLLATASFDATTAIWENVGGDFECVSTLEVKIKH
jgi:WD40 repeat protein